MGQETAWIIIEILFQTHHHRWWPRPIKRATQVKLDRPLVAGHSIGHKPRLPMLFNGTWDQLNN